LFELVNTKVALQGAGSGGVTIVGAIVSVALVFAAVAIVGRARNTRDDEQVARFLDEENTFRNLEEPSTAAE